MQQNTHSTLSSETRQLLLPLLTIFLSRPLSVVVASTQQQLEPRHAMTSSSPTVTMSNNGHQLAINESDRLLHFASRPSSATSSFTERPLFGDRAPNRVSTHPLCVSLSPSTVSVCPLFD